MNSAILPSTQPYLLRALHEWCSDNGFTPYLAVRVDESVQVPREYVQNGEIVLNISHDATVNLRLGNEEIEFQARFGGVPRRIIVPVGRVLAIYARENGQGMAFAVPPDGAGAAAADVQPPPPPSLAAGAASDSPPVPASPGAATPEASDAAPKKARNAPRKAAAPRASAPKAAPILHAVPADSGSGGDDEPSPPGPPAGGKRPALRRVK
ncbi:ClpXP protease specificity-enhancing factor [Corticibacter populi]|uniref:ClpXP protease specificity-enhancing factor n=1 Tax=Corticibacter populi TaxID=1550736 RepID=A0A3M6QXR7_9BURK|nr:ClpXP protease specificity-enhancing factor [Corticibacter populi]RMX07808.1 ClpXP protease specificity-enhancing factor [Corticibacter populi]RZS35036.1 stringent starvation protein B [Corticibacter populi]